jgi:O-antigen ligase
LTNNKYRISLTEIPTLLGLLFAVSLAFQRTFPFLPNFSYTKYAGILYFIALLIHYLLSTDKKNIRIDFRVIVLISIYLLCSFFSLSFLETGDFGNLIYTPFLWNIILYIAITAHQRYDQNICINMLFFYAIGFILMSVVAFSTGNFTYTIDSRLSVGSALPNAIGFSALGCVSILLYLRNSTPETRSKFSPLCFIGLLIASYVLIQSASRGAAIGFLFILMLLIFEQRKFLRRDILVVGAIIIALLIYLFYDQIKILNRLGSTLNNFEFGGRIKIWTNVLTVFIDNGMLGMGEQKYNEALIQLISYSPSPHNAFLEILVIGGIPAALLFIYFLVAHIGPGIFSCGNSKKNYHLYLIPYLLLTISSDQLMNDSLAFIMFAVLAGQSRENSLGRGGDLNRTNM